jgi:hypothetical protein
MCESETCFLHYLDNISKRVYNRQATCGNGEKMKEKVVVLRELQRAIIYTNELSKQAIEGDVSRAFTV